MALGLSNSNREAGYKHGKQVPPPPGAGSTCDDEFGCALGSGSSSPPGDALVLERRSLGPDLPHADGRLFPAGAQLPMLVPCLVRAPGEDGTDNEAATNFDNVLASREDGSFLETGSILRKAETESSGDRSLETLPRGDMADEKGSGDFDEFESGFDDTA